MSPFRRAPTAIVLVAGLALTLGFAPLRSAEPSRIIVPGGVVSGNVTWRTGHVVEVHGNLRLAPNALLTIEAGVQVEAAPGSRIVVPRTSRIVADGTFLQPVVFTCAGAAKFAGCWSGLVIQGYAPLNTGTTTSPPARGNGVGGCRELTNGDTGTSYGGCDPSDSSGVLRYARIEFAGSTGLRLEGVGRRTVLDFIQANRAEGTGLSIQGGTANLK